MEWMCEGHYLHNHIKGPNSHKLSLKKKCENKEKIQIEHQINAMVSADDWQIIRRHIKECIMAINHLNSDYL